jgi:predicted acetyltransferase
MRLWLSAFKPRPVAPAWTFLDSPVPLVDGNLELVEPAARWVDAVLQTTRRPDCAGDPCEHLSRMELLRFVDRTPRGRQTADPSRDLVPGYTFWMRLRSGPIGMAGSVSLRIGDDQNLRCYLGQIGYGVYPPARGQRLAERATRLLFPLAKAHGMKALWITANPDNVPSRRTCERLGGILFDVVKLPTHHPLSLRGDTHKCIYRIDL